MRRPRIAASRWAMAAGLRDARKFSRDAVRAAKEGDCALADVFSDQVKEINRTALASIRVGTAERTTFRHTDKLQARTEATVRQYCPEDYRAWRKRSLKGAKKDRR